MIKMDTNEQLPRKLFHYTKFYIPSSKYICFGLQLL